MDQIYREELMEIYKNPPHRGQLKDPTICKKQTNPMCGDEVFLQLKIKNNKIKGAKFDGSACAVSVIASANLLDHIIGKDIKDIKNITNDNLLDMMELNLTTSRIKCATLILKALKQSIKTYETKQKIKVTKESNIADVVFKYPEIAEILLDYGLHCVGCAASSSDTIEMGAEIHGLTTTEIDEMIDLINKSIHKSC